MKLNTIPARRRILSAALGIAMLGAGRGVRAQAAPLSDGAVLVQYLGWAGVKLEYGSNALFIDPQLVFQNRPGLKIGTAPITSKASSRYAVITHLHAYHFDPTALKQALSDDGTVFAVPSMAPSVAAKGLPVVSVALWEPKSAGDFDGHDFVIVPVPAADGLGDPQVSWVIKVAGRSFIHCGDTIWHGQWRHIGRAFGPFDVAFLPINGFNETDLFPSSEEPSAMTPENAVQAARLLQARMVVPIHFGRTPSSVYVETREPERRFLAAAQRGGQAVQVMRAGDEMRLRALREP